MPKELDNEQLEKVNGGMLIDDATVARSLGYGWDELGAVMADFISFAKNNGCATEAACIEGIIASHDIDISKVVFGTYKKYINNLMPLASENGFDDALNALKNLSNML